MSRIKLSVGNLSVEYEGEQEFIENRLLGFVEGLTALSGSLPAAQVSVPTSHEERQLPGGPELSTNTLAQMIGTKTGSELALAAICKINIIKGKPIASRQEILDEMRGATTYFRETYASNLSSSLDTLVKGKRINLVAKGSFALGASERGRLEEILGRAQ